LASLEGWDREDDAFDDISALAYVSGPMYERHVDAAGQELTVPLGDLKFGAKVWMGRNRAASRQRAFIGIQKDGSVDFGYGELTDARSNDTTPSLADCTASTTIWKIPLIPTRVLTASAWVSAFATTCRGFAW
jgi:hypothetical protein